ncbi:hypothetical protein EMCRGX_G010266 [Ephydatia muelleri]
MVGFDERFVQVTEAINNSINICGFVSSLTGIWKSNLSAILVINNSTAKGMEDYIIPSDAIAFSSWTSPKSTRWCVNILIIDDNIVEDSEQLTLELVSTNPLVTVQENFSLVTVNITEQPTDYVVIEMQYSSLSVIESNSTVTVCAVIISGILGKNVTVVMVTHSITAIDRKDYIGGKFTLVFTSGQTANGNNLQCIDLVLIDDHEFENQERLFIVLSSTPEFASVVRISPAKKELLVVINEIPTTDIIQIGMMESFYQAVEGETPFVTICAVLYQGALARDLTVMLTVLNSTVGDTAISGRDYILQSQTLTFVYDESNNISSTPCVNVTILDDHFPENDLYVTLGLSVASNDSSDVFVGPGKNQTTIKILDDDQGILVGFDEHFVQVTEAINNSINICGFVSSLTGIWKSNLSAILMVVNSTAKGMEDYIIPSDAITFSSWTSPESTRWCVNILIIDDNIVEDSEQLTLELVSMNPLVSVQENFSLITVNITEQPTDYVVIEMQYSSLSVIESNSTVTVCAVITSGILGKNVTVVMVTHSITAIDGNDYVGGNFTLVFTSGQAAIRNNLQCIDLVLIDDHEFENEERLFIVLSSTPEFATVVRSSPAKKELLVLVASNDSSDLFVGPGKNQTTIKILDDDHGILVGFNERFVQVTEAINNSINICGFVSSLTGIWKSNLSAILVVVNSTAKDMEDYIIPSDAITFSSWTSPESTRWCVNILIIDDNIVEDTEQLTLELVSMNPLVTVQENFSLITVNITEQPTDYVVIELQYSSLSVIESNSTVTVCAVITSGILGKNVTVVMVTHSITAFDGKDYIGGNFTLVFTSGQAAIGNHLQCINLVLIDDHEFENEERLFIALSSTPECATVVRISPAKKELLVLINEIPTTDIIQIGMMESFYRAVEGETPFVTICAVLYQGALARDLTVMLTVLNSTVGDTAISGRDYILQSQTLTFVYDESNNISSTPCVNVTILDDHFPENDLYVTLGLSVASNDSSDVFVGPRKNQTTIKILDDDHGIMVGFDERFVQVTEAINNSINICGFVGSLTGIWKSNLSAIIVVVKGTSKGMEDYIIPSDAITFSSWTSPESTRWCVNILIIDDNTVEDSEQLTLELVSTNPLVSIQENFSLITVNITEQPTDYVVIEMQYSSLSVIESNSTVTVCAAITSGILGKNVTVVMVTHSITAIDGKDYVGGNFTLVFTSGQAAIGNHLQCINLVLIDDHEFENEERLFIALNSTPEFATVVRLSPAKKELLVLINEIPTTDIIQIGMMESFYRAVEGETPFVTICAVLYQGALARDLTVMLTVLNSTVGDTAISGLDYILQFQTLTFVYDESNNISSTPCVNVTILDDHFPENDLYVTLGLSVASNDSSDVFVGPGKNQTTIKILDDDHRILVGFDERFVQVTEAINNSINICGLVSSLTGIWKSNLSAILMVVNSTAKGMEDYIIPSDAITFSSWTSPESTRWCVNILIIDDNIVEDSEQLTLELVSTNQLVSVQENFSLITVNITEQPTDYVVIEMQYSSLSVIESNSTVTVCAVITSGILGKNVTVVMVTHSITAIDRKDYVGGNFTLVFSSGQAAVGNNLQCIDLVLIDDHEFENEERLFIALSSTPEFATVVRISPAKKELLVLINEIPTTDIIQIGMMESFYRAVEKETPFVTICAVLYQGALARDLTVMLTVLNSTVGDTAISGRDYILQSQTLTFVYDESNNISSTPCVNVTILDDHFPENDLYVTLGLSVASNDSSDVFVGHEQNQTTIKILDDDHGVLVGFDERFVQVTEAINNSINICGFVSSLTGIWKSNLSAIIVVVNSTAKDMEDYIIPSDAITFSSWTSSESTRWCVNILIIDDNTVEDLEQLTLELVSTNPLVTVQENVSLITVNITEQPTDYVVIEMQYSSLSVIESNSTVTVCAVITSGILGKNVTVVMVTHSITAFDGKDYIGGNFTLVFTSGQSAIGNMLQCIDLVLIDDHEFENVERLFIALSTTPEFASVVRISPAKKELLLLINEIPTTDIIQIGMMESFYQAVEGETPFVTICAILYQGALARDLTVMLTVLNSTVGDTAISGHDYILQSQTLTFVYDESNNISSTPCVNVTILDNHFPNNDLYVTLGLSVASNDSSDVFLGPGKNQTTVKILDDDHGILVGFDERSVQVTEAINNSINICGFVSSLTGIWKSTLSAIVVVVNSTAKDMEDYIIPSDAITFSSWTSSESTRWCVNILIIDDNTVEDLEQLTLELVSTNPLVTVQENVSLITVNITEQPTDYVVIEMQYSSLSVIESNSTVTVCAVITSGILGKNVTVVMVTHSITAFDGKDYIGGNFTLVFTSGQAAIGNHLQCINLVLIDDHAFENEERLFIALSATPEFATVVRISPAKRELLVLINEIPTTDIIQIGMMESFYRAVEGETPFVTICAVLYQGALARDLTVMLTVLNSTVGDTAISGHDYILQSQTLTFMYDESNNISSTPCVNVTILDDHFPENNLYVTLGLSVASNDNSDVFLGPGKNQTTIKIVDDDHGVLVGFDERFVQVTEAINNSINICGFVSSLTGIWKSNLSAIIVVVNSTAKDIEDYIIPSDAITFSSWISPESTRWCVNILIIDDNIVEDSEQLTLELVSTNPLVTVQENFSLVTVNITEQPTDYVVIEMQYSSLSVIESNSTVTVCAVITSGILGKNVTVVMVTHSITAIDGKDYIGGNFTLVFTSGQSAIGNMLQCIDLVLIDDHEFENEERLFIALNSTSEFASVVRISPAKKELLLLINEIPTTDIIQIGMKESFYQAVEGQTSYDTICAVLYQGALARDLTVMLTVLNSTVGDTAISGHDYILQSQTLTFVYDESNNISSTPCVNVTILDDHFPDNDLYVTLGLSVASNDSSDVFLGPGKNQTTIKILDDDHGILVGFDERFVQVTEAINNSINICGFVRSLTGIWKSNLSAIVVVVNSTAKDMEDYIIPSDAITFSSWTSSESTRWCVYILIIDDNTVEDLEQLTLELVSTNPLVTVQENFSLVTVNITEQPTDYVVIEMQYSSLSVIESNSTVTVCAVITSGILGKNVTVVMVTHSITAFDGKDYIGGNFTLVFASGQSAIGINLQCIDLVLIDDHEFENEERLFIVLNSTPEFASVVRISPAKKELLVLIKEIPTTDIIQIGMKESFYRAVEKETPFVTICAVLYQGALARDLTVMLTVLNSTVGDTAISGRDYILQSQTLTFVYDESNNISSTPCVNVTILDDYFPENDLYVTLGLLVASNDSSDVFVGPGKNQTTIKILDDDHGILVGFDERFVQVTEAINNSINICGFLRSLTGIWKSNLSAILVVVNSTAKGMEDYIIPSDAITFWSWTSPESTRWCVNILIIDDNIVEDSEQLTLELVSTNPLVTVQENFSLVTVNITEQPTDYVVIEMQYLSLSISENNSYATVCAVITSGILGKNVTVVMVTHSITAIDRKDYVGGIFTLVFTSGQSAVGNNLQCIDLVLIDDHEFENEEHLSITLISTSEFASVVRISPIKKELLVLIIEIPTTDIIQIGMKESFYQAVEGETPFVTICAVLYQGALARDLTVMLTVLNSTVGDTAISGHDYVLQSQTLTFMYDESNNISSTPCVNVTILDDHFPENDLYVTLGLSVASNDSNDVFVGPGKNQTTVKILDDDHGIIVGFRDPFFEVTEGVNMSINICGFLNSQTGVWKNNLTAIIVAKSGTAKEFEDYYLPNNVITFASWSSLGGRQWCFPVSIFDDKLLENSDQLMFQIVSTNPLVVVEGNSSTATINIKEDIDDYIEVQMQYPSITVGEVNSVAKLCAVISVGAVGENVTVVLQTHSITAIDGKDYIGGTFTLMFIPGQSASSNNLICVNLTILNDYLLEYNETFIVTLNSTQQDSNYIRISTIQNITLVTIIEDPQDAIQIGMTKTYVEVVDGEQSYVPICAVILKGELGHDVMVELSILDTSLGTKGVDYILKLHTLTFTKGESADANSTHCVNVTLIDDEIPKNEEYFVIGLSPVPVDSVVTVIVSDKNETIVAVMDDDHEFTIGMQYRYYTANEKTGSVTICVIVMDTTTAIRGIINITISTNGTATAGSDYIIPHTISIDSTYAVIGNIFCLNATILDDFTVEYDEYFIVFIAVQNQSRVNVISNYSTSVVTVTEDIMDYVNIGFRQSEYTVYDWINSTVQICIWLSMGVLERNVTITVGTETAHNTTAVPGVNYLPLSKNLTFSPNESTMLYISLTILVDHNSAEKMLTLSISTEDQAVHVTLNRTVIKIQSQTQPPAALTPRTAVIAVTIWMLLLLLCCLMCLFCCLLWRKRQKKRKKVAQEGQRNEVDPIIIHEIKRNKVGIELLPIHKRQGGASLHEAATEPPIHQRKGCTTFNKDGMELLPIHERKETTVLNKDGMELLPLNKRMASSNRVNIKQDRIELLPIHETKWNTSSNKTIENKDVIELLPVHETTGDFSSSTHLLARNNGTVLQNDVIELLPIHERKGYTPLDNDAIKRKGGATLQKDKKELLPIHNWKGDTSSNKNAIKINESATLQQDGIEMLPIQQRKEDTPLIKDDNSKKRVNLLNQDRIELSQMNKDTSTKNAFDSKECATLQKGTNRLLPIHSTNGDTPQKEDERESKLSTRIDRIKFPPLSEKHHETLPNKSMTERNGDTKLQIDRITAIDDKKGPSLNMDKTVSKEDRNLVLIQEQESETSRRKETTEGERSISSIKKDGMKRQFTRANTKDHHPLNNGTLKREEGVSSKEEGPINKDRSKKKGGFALKKSGTKLLSPHERKSGTLFNTDGIELLPIHQRLGWTSLNDGEINLPSAPQVAPLYEHRIELLPIHTPLGTIEVRRKNVTSFDTEGTKLSEGASATIDLIPIHGRKGNGSLHHSGLVTIAAQESKSVQMHKDDIGSFSVFMERTEGKNIHTNAYTLETVPHSMGILHPNADWKEVELIEDNWKYVTEQNGIQPGNKHSINYNSIDKVQPTTNKSGHEAICEDSSLQPTIGVDSEFNAVWAKKLTRQEAWF